MTNHANQTPGREALLDSWKEIAAYLQRDVSTAVRWEKLEGLPVHRHQHDTRASVYAYPSEIDVWRAARKPKSGAELQAPPWRRLIPALAGGVALLAAASIVQWGPIMNPPDPLAEAAGPGVVVRQVWADRSTDDEGTPSPDGRYISAVDWETGDIAIRNTDTGESRHLTNKGRWEENGDEYGARSAFSPDGKHVAFTWLNWRANNPYGPGELRLASVDEPSEPRILYRSEEVEYVHADGWSPDGKHVLVLVNRKDRTNQIGLVSIADGSLRILKSFDWRSPIEMAFSPDGKYILYDFPIAEKSPERDIFLLSSDGSSETALITHPADDYVLGWTPDGDGILFASDRTGNWDIWLSSLSNGRAGTPPKLLKRDVGQINPIGVTREGAFYYGVQGSNSDVYEAALDRETGKLEGSPKRVSTRFVGRNSGPDWSPDGRYLSFVSRRGPDIGLERTRSTGWTLVIRSLKTGRDREIPLALTNFQRLRPRWSPDGRILLAPGTDRKGREGVYRIDAEAGEMSAVVQHLGPDEFVSWSDWAAEGEAVVYSLHHRITRERRIISTGLKDGQETQLHKDTTEGSYFEDGAVSPDGRWIAFHTPAGLEVMAAVGGPTRKLFHSKERNAHRVHGITWTPDSRHLLFTTGGYPDRGLWRVPLEGGTPQPVGLQMNMLGTWGLNVHPGGKRIAFHAIDQPERYTTEVWVMENFLPETRAAK